MAGNSSAPGEGVVTRAMRLLYAFDESHRRLTLSQLAERANLPVATTHRLAASLVATGALERRPGGDFVVGRRLWGVGLLAPLQSGLREVASPFLNDLHAATRATVHLAIREHTQALYLDRLAGQASVPVLSTIGSRLPLHATGVGKVLLAHAPDAVVDEAMRNLPRLTPYTLTQPERLRDQLERVRRDGFATTVEEMTLGACSAAVPVQVPRGEGVEVVAALGVVVPQLRRGRGPLVAALQVAAQGIGRSLARGF